MSYSIQLKINIIQELIIIISTKQYTNLMNQLAMQLLMTLGKKQMKMWTNG